MKSHPPAQPYNEVQTQGRSRLHYRPHYRDAWDTHARLTRSQIASASRAAKLSFDRDAAILPFPRILTRTEFETIASGVAQRGRALQLFLHDHYLGKRRYQAAGSHFGNDFARSIQRTLARNGETLAKKILRPGLLQFWYAPDIIRDPDGRFRILEDNVGLVGGIGDLVATQQAAQDLHFPASLRYAQTDAREFYRNLAAEYLQQARGFGRGLTVMLSYPTQLCTTHEDVRFEKLMTDCGVVTLRARLKGQRSAACGILVERDGKIFLQRPRTDPQLVSFVILNVDHADIEPLHPVTTERFRVHRVSKLDPIGTPGFWKAVKNGHVGVNTAPGMEFVGDKEFYIYVEDLIRLYLGESPILPNLETFRLGGRSGTLRLSLASVFSDLDPWVIKGANGRGGDQVWIGHRLSRAQVRKLHERVREDPFHYIAQRYTPLSTVIDHHVDLRLHAMIGPKTEIISPIPWGRAMPISGDGKINVSNQGMLSLVSVVPDATYRLA